MPVHTCCREDFSSSVTASLLTKDSTTGIRPSGLAMPSFIAALSAAVALSTKSRYSVAKRFESRRATALVESWSALVSSCVMFIWSAQSVSALKCPVSSIK